MTIWSLAAGHGPVGSFVCHVSVTVVDVVPVGSSLTAGVYIAFAVFLFGSNVPRPPIHWPLEAPPPKEADSVTLAPVCDVAQTGWSGPAFAVAGGLYVMTIWSLAAGHGPVGSLVCQVSVTVVDVVPVGSSLG